EDIISSYGFNGEIRERIGNGHLSLAPAEVYRTKDKKWILIHAALDKAFVNLAIVMEQPNLSKDERFSSTRSRAKNANQINDIVSEWVNQHDADYVIDLLQKNNVPVSPINSVEDIFNDQHIQARENIIKTEDPHIGEVNLP